MERGEKEWGGRNGGGRMCERVRQRKGRARGLRDKGEKEDKRKRKVITPVDMDK